jgi:lipopolysaccharide/colanic/teichoic acid biosynthesis glycosyltransferase
MTLVGPRPEIPQMLPHYRPDELAKFSVKPGLTGMAQTRGRNILRFQQTIALDLDYVRNRSLWLDLRILVRTPIVVVAMIGAL